MQILVISQYWEPENGVPQRRWAWFSDILETAGHKVIALVPPPHYETKIPLSAWVTQTLALRRGAVKQFDSGVVRTHFFPGGTSLIRKSLNQATVALSQVASIIRLRKDIRLAPQLIIGTVPALPTAFVTLAASRLLNVPFVIDLRDAWPELLDESRRWNESVGQLSLRHRILQAGPLQLVKAIVRRTLKQALMQASAVIVTTEAHREQLLRNLQTWDSHKSHQVVVIRNVFPVPVEAVAKGPLKIDAHPLALNVLYAGTLGRAQDLENALKAAHLANKQGVRIKFTFVGAGAAKAKLKDTARSMNLDARFDPRSPSESLGAYYDWADTALVHLADWPALSLSVPSKTYELMELGIHITGVVKGEAARLISVYGAGHVVAPGEPSQLADLWVSLARNPATLKVSASASKWVKKERMADSPTKLRNVVESVRLI